jgi:pyridoxal phosphate-dependent aminotransferase EpsN
MSGLEHGYVNEAFKSNWIAPLGPNVDAFETEFRDAVGAGAAAALTSGTAALHLALRLAGVAEGDVVCVSTLTFAASVYPILYLGARPVLIDSERESWNMDPTLLRQVLAKSAARGRLPKAVVVVHLYGQCADMDRICAICNEFGVAVIEDAAEALGASYRDRSPGTFGQFGVFSFNGNKILTTSGGGMLVSHDAGLIDQARNLAAQAREPAAHYEHRTVGYNYRMSNVLAGIGRGQLRVLDDRVRARRANFEFYRRALGDQPGIEFMPEPCWGRSTRWLTCCTIDPNIVGTDREAIRHALEAADIEARPVWKPMHLQPVFAGFEHAGGEVAEDLFHRGLCLPSGSNMTTVDLDRVVDVVLGMLQRPDIRVASIERPEKRILRRRRLPA